jgi:hypothetical protein
MNEIEAHPNSYHCSECGSNFLEENQLNRLTITEAVDLAHEKVDDRDYLQIKLCPRDSLPLRRLSEDSIPAFITILRCDKCHGVFLTAKDLMIFKKAQHAKVAFYKTWQIPLPSLTSVLVYSFALTFAFATFTFMQNFYQKNATPTQAESIVRNVHVVKNQAITTIYFTTDKDYSSSIIFYKDSQPIEKGIISSIPTQAHIAKITTIQPDSTITFKIFLKSGDQVIESDAIPYIVNTKSY